MSSDIPLQKSFMSDVGLEKLTSDDPKEILMRRWRQPTLSIHGSYIGWGQVVEFA
jgi:hypothetical protein